MGRCPICFADLNTAGMCPQGHGYPSVPDSTGQRFNPMSPEQAREAGYIEVNATPTHESQVLSLRQAIAARDETIEKLWLVLTYNHKCDFRRTAVVEAIKNHDPDALLKALGVEEKQ